MRTFLFLTLATLFSSSFAAPSFSENKVKLYCQCYSAEMKYRLQDLLSVKGFGQEVWAAKMNAEHRCSKKLTTEFQKRGKSVVHVQGRVFNCGETVIINGPDDILL